MSSGFFRIAMSCRIGKKADKSDCAKKDCGNCRHWVECEVWIDCNKCKNDCVDCPNRGEA